MQFGILEDPGPKLLHMEAKEATICESDCDLFLILNLFRVLSLRVVREHLTKHVLIQNNLHILFGES